MKKVYFILMIGLLVCMLAGCGEAKEPETADEALEQIESEIEEMIAEEEEEKTPEESLVDVYVPGTIPPGTYVKEGGTATLYIYEDNEFEFDTPYSYRRDVYEYDADTGVYTFDRTIAHEDQAFIAYGYYEDGNIVITSFDYVYSDTLDHEGEFVYVRQ